MPVIFSSLSICIQATPRGGALFHGGFFFFFLFPFYFYCSFIFLFFFLFVHFIFVFNGLIQINKRVMIYTNKSTNSYRRFHSGLASGAEIRTPYREAHAFKKAVVVISWSLYLVQYYCKRVSRRR